MPANQIKESEKIDLFGLNRGFLIPSDTWTYNDKKMTGMDKYSAGYD